MSVIEGILPKVPYPPCLRMADRAILAGYPRYIDVQLTFNQLNGVLGQFVWCHLVMGLLPDMQNCWLRMRRECRERFPRQRYQRKPLVSDPGIHRGTCGTHVP